MTILGIDEQGNPVEISVYDRLTSVYCLGATGSGKTTLLQNIILQDIEAGIGVCLLDPHGDLIDKIINKIPWNRINDVILLDPIELAKQEYYFGLNLFECIDTNNVEFYQHTVEQVMETFKKLWGPGSENPSWGPQLEDLLLNITITLIENQGYTFAEVPMLLRNDAFRKRLVDTLTNSQVKSFWEWEYNPLSPKDQREMSFSTLNKVRIFTTNPIVYYTTAQSHTTINFRTIMDVPPPEPGKILLIRLDRSLAVMTSFIGSILINQLLLAALSRRDIPEKERRIFCLFCDEFQNFATPSMNTLLVEARKYRVASHLFHQTRQQEGITDSIRSTTMGTGSLVVFRVNPDDAKELAPSFDLTPRPGDPIERPVRVYKQEVVKHLLEKGHTNKDANDYVNELLRPIQELIDRMSENTYRIAQGGRILKDTELYRDKYTYYTFRTHLKDGMSQIDRILVEAMTGKNPPGSDGFKTMAVAAIMTLRGYLEIQGGMLDEDTEKLPLRTGLIDLVSQMVDYECSNFERDILADPPVIRKIAAWHIEEMRRILDYDAIKKNGNFTNEFIEESLKFRASLERGGISGFITWLYLLSKELVREPVMVDSGKYETVEGPRQTYSDRANEVANELTQLPRFHAKVKIPSGEYIIYNDPPQGDFKSLAAKKQQIIGNTKRLYCKSRAEIEEEIRRRQEPPEPPTTRKYTL